MTPHQFIPLVKKLRHAQREYFRTRDTAWLRSARTLEKEVDEALKGLTETPLFGGPDDDR